MIKSETEFSVSETNEWTAEQSNQKTCHKILQTVYQRMSLKKLLKNELSPFVQKYG